VKAIDATTRKWISNVADEKAAAAGMRFDAERGAFACDWMERYCCLYEGERAGEPLVLYPAQREFFMRLFGWVRWSDEWGQWIRRFTHAAVWKAKKNGKSPEAAAYNLYLACGEGEPGQKVYMMAHDGGQARIAQMHAVNMVEQSPALAADCAVNKTTLQITHGPSRSVIMVVTGDNKRTADSKHGYNGSVTIDEMHVVNRQMMEAVGRAGISRKEPLQTSFSTAGTDPSSVGFERCQYGRQVNAGERDDPHFLHVEYAAPADMTPAEIDSRLDEFGRMANPAWGNLVKPSEFRADWNRSKSEPRKVAIFLQERLNVWVGSKARWLDQAGWERGRRKFTLADMRGRQCFLGLDLSRTRDMTAAPLLFPWDEDDPEAVRIWPQFWLPEKRAADLDHLYPFRSWSAAGHLTLTAGDVVDYARVEADIVAAVEEHGLIVGGVYFDPWNAEEITQRLADRLGCEWIVVW
jgi:phage terminase large subunit-like protein